MIPDEIELGPDAAEDVHREDRPPAVGARNVPHHNEESA